MAIVSFNKRVTLLLLSSFFLFACGGGGGGGSTPEIPAPPTFTMTFSNSSHVTDEDQSITASFNISTSSSSSITYSTITASQYGNVSYSSSNNSFTYTPNANYFGTDSFVVSASAQGVTRQATISLTVNSINDAPIMSLTQPTNNEGDTLYPLVLTNDENKFDVNLSFSDIETPVSDLIVTATTNAGESIVILHEEGSDISSLDISNANAGPAEINISVSDGEETITDTLQVWITRYIAIDNLSDPYSGNRAYTIYGDHSDINRKTNYVIISDALPDEERVDGFRSSLKTWVDLINKTELAQFLGNFFSIGVIETPLSSESAIGTAIGCDSRDPNIYCFTNEWKTALDSLTDQYFENVDSRSIITGIDGRGVANYGWSLNIQDIPSTDSPTIRRVVSTLKHEFGHSYSLLADEYTTVEVNCNDFNCGQIETGPNTTAEDEPEKVRWNHHIEDLTNIPGYHDSTTEDGIGYFRGVYWSSNAGFRPSYSTIMNGFPSGWTTDGEITREILWDKIGNEAFAIRALIFQGMHSIETSFDENNDLVVSHNFVDPSGLFEVEWYLNGEKVDNDSNTLLVQRKSSGYEYVSYRIKEKTQNIIIATDEVLNFRDIYSGLFASDTPWWWCPEPLTSNPSFQDSYCKNTLQIKWTNYPGLYKNYFYENVDALINSQEVSWWGLQYWYEYSGLGAMFGINWAAN